MLCPGIIRKVRTRRSMGKPTLTFLLKLCFCIFGLCFILSLYNGKKVSKLTLIVKSLSNRQPLQEQITTATITINTKPKPTQNSKPKSKPTLKPKGDEFRKVCSVSTEINGFYGKFHSKTDPSLPVIFAITPTYERPEMIPELTRLGQTLLLVPNLHWILAEDSKNCSEPVADLLNSFGLPYTHLVSPMPDRFKKSKAKPKGVSNRRAALEWIKEYADDQDVFYFLDDDNTINVKLFDEIRFTKKVSMFPVGLIGNYRVSAPVVKKGKIVGFYDSWAGGRKFQIDMAGFAVNIGFLRKHEKATMPYSAGYEEDGFLKTLNISLSEIEPMANGCTNILVWHTKTSKNKRASLDLSTHKDDNIKELAQNMRKWTVIK